MKTNRTNLFLNETLKRKKNLSISAFLLLANMYASAQVDCNASSWLMQNASTNQCTGYLYDDGGAGANYTNSKTYVFTIAPGSVTAITLKFTQFSLENGFDYLRIYNGLSATGTPANTYTGTTIPATVTYGGAITIKFTSDSEVNSTGFAAIWTATGGDCGPVFNISNYSVNPPRGTIYDSGGPSANYSNSETISFIISPADATTICLKFSEFNLENNVDYLKIYNVVSGGTPIYTLTGTTIPGNATSNTGVMRLDFTSNGSVTNTGFAAIWTSDGTPFAHLEERSSSNLTTHDMGTGIRIFPNPATTAITISFSLKEEEQTKVIVYNTAGIETIVLNKVLSTGEQTVNFDATHLTAGVYFCKVITANNVLVEKIIKN